MTVADGYYDGQIAQVEIIRARFAAENENALEVELTCGVYDAAHKPMPERVKVYLELSANYPKFGDTTKTFWEQSLTTLHELGFSGDDLATLATQLVGKPVRLNYRSKDKNGNPMKNPGWYLTRTRERVVVAASKANEMLKAMMSGAVGVPVAPTPAAAPAAVPSPFN